MHPGSSWTCAPVAAAPQVGNRDAGYGNQPAPTIRATSLLHPLIQLLVAPAVDHARGGNTGQARVRDRVIAEPQLPDRVRVAVERENATGVERTARELEVDVLAVPVAVELDRDADAWLLRRTRASQSAVTPGRLLNIRPRGWPRMVTPRAAHRAEHPRPSDRPVGAGASAATPRRTRTARAPPAAGRDRRRPGCSLRFP